jgi:hypothetical protein
MVDTYYHVELDKIIGSVESGGWEASLNFMNDQDAIEYSREGMIDVRFEGGGVWGDFGVALSGHIFPQGVRFDRRQSSAEAVLATAHRFLQYGAAQGMLFEQSDTPSNKHETSDLTLGWIIYHIVNEHTNITDLGVDLSGIDVVNSTAVNIYSVSETKSIWSTIKKIGDDEFHVPYFTRENVMMYDVHPMIQYADTLPDPAVAITPSMIIGQPEIEYRDAVRPDYVELYALTDDGETLRSSYPSTDLHTGDKRRHREDHLRCNTQARLDILAAQLYSFLHRDYELTITLPGAFGLEMELYERVTVTYSGTTANGITVAWTAKAWWIDTITIRRVHNFGAVTELRLQEEITPQGYFYD